MKTFYRPFGVILKWSNLSGFTLKLSQEEAEVETRVSHRGRSVDNETSLRSQHNIVLSDPDCNQ